MADTSRTRSYLISTALADNSSGAIDEQDLRDVVYSLTGNAAMIKIHNNSTAQSITNGSDILLDWGNGGADVYDDHSSTTWGVGADYANDRIRIFTQGVYLIMFNASFKDDGGGALLWTFKLYAGNTTTAALNINVDEETATSTEEHNVGLVGIYDASAVTMPAEVEIYVAHSAGAAENLTVTNAQLVVSRIL